VIKISKSPTADTRTCDFSNVSEEQLLDSTLQHIEDVRQALSLFESELKIAGIKHDCTKVDNIEDFHSDFKGGFKSTKWYEMHQEKERHHLGKEQYVQDDVNLLDVLEMIADGVMAGMARSGEYRKEDIPADLLTKAFSNTVDLLLRNVEVE